ncbi:MAG: rhomboid family intramembrane serine protease [Pseudomonadota bacterium]
MRVIETSLHEDLSRFSSYLWQHRVVHRVYEERGAQVLEVRDAAHAELVRDAYGAWRDGRLRLEAAPRAAPVRRWWRGPARYPGLTVLIALALVVFPFSYPLSNGELTALTAWLAIIDPRTPQSELPTLVALLGRLEVWRWFTPMFLHFSALHLAFNCAVVIELGRRVERGLSAAGLWGVVLVLAGVSNLVQYAFGSPLFGGLSGVAYGLLGFVLVMKARRPESAHWQFPGGIAVGLLVFLVILSTGVTEPFGLHVANAAHWGGLVAGALLALAVAGIRAHD